MNVNIETEILDGCGGPVYNEPHDGFFKDQGFNVNDRAFGFCQLRDSCEKRIGITLEGALDEDDELPLPLAPVIASERVIFYEGGDVSLNFGNFAFGSLDDPNGVKCTSLYDIVQKEEAGEDTVPTIKAMLDAVHKSGSKTWHGYVVSLATSGSYQVALVEEDFAGARKSVDDFVDYAVQTALDVYSKLDAQKIQGLTGKLPQLCETLAMGMFSMMQDVTSGSFDDEVESLPEDEQYQKGTEIVESPIKDWLPKFEGELQKAGLDQCEKEFYDKITDYCASNGIKLVKSEFGNDFRKATIMGMFEDATR